MTLLYNTLQLSTEHAGHKENTSSTVSAQTALGAAALGAAGEHRDPLVFEVDLDAGARWLQQQRWQHWKRSWGSRRPRGQTQGKGGDLPL